jgi:hypothetical protein
MVAGRKQEAGPSARQRIGSISPEGFREVTHEKHINRSLHASVKCSAFVQRERTWANPRCSANCSYSHTNASSTNKGYLPNF